jgi:hypothetical protein
LIDGGAAASLKCAVLSPATVVDRYGRRLEPDDDVVPDGATVRVALPFADALSARTARVLARDSARDRFGFLVRHGASTPLFICAKDLLVAAKIV